jgi:Aspartyl protease
LKKFTFISIMLLLIISCSQKTNPELVKTLNILVESKKFFQLEEKFLESRHLLSKNYELFYSAIIHNVFNELNDSNNDIARLLSDTDHGICDSMLFRLYETKISNHIKLFEYSEAVDVTQLLINEYDDFIDIENNNYYNQLNLFSALVNVPKQEIIKNQDCLLDMYKDITGLWNISVNVVDIQTNFLFDTGFNFSGIRKSLAKKYKFHLLPADFYVTSFTGMKVDCDLAYADSISIENIYLKNVVFLVYEDADLSFPEYNYKINGIIGFPVIAAMEEIHINKKNQLFIPKIMQDFSIHNLAIDFLTPIVSVNHKSNSMIFKLDTGSDGTLLYSNFYQLNKPEIDANYDLGTFSTFGAGGEVEYNGYFINGTQLEIGNGKATLDSLLVFVDDIGSVDKHFHGNLGQDFIQQFDEMIISYRKSAIDFK